MWIFRSEFFTPIYHDFVLPIPTFWLSERQFLKILLTKSRSLATLNYKGLIQSIFLSLRHHDVFWLRFFTFNLEKIGLQFSSFCRQLDQMRTLFARNSKITDWKQPENSNFNFKVFNFLFKIIEDNAPFQEFVWASSAKKLFHTKIDLVVRIR